MFCCKINSRSHWVREWVQECNTKSLFLLTWYWDFHKWEYAECDVTSISQQEATFSWWNVTCNLTISACVGWLSFMVRYVGSHCEHNMIMSCWLSTIVICNWWHQNKTHHTHSRHSRHFRHLDFRGGDSQCDYGEEMINNRHQLQLLTDGLICVGGWGLVGASVS